MSGHFFGNEIKLTRRYRLGLSIVSENATTLKFDHASFEDE